MAADAPSNCNDTGVSPKLAPSIAASAPSVSTETAELEAHWLPKTKQGKPEKRADALYSLGKECFEVRDLDLSEKYLREALAIEQTLKRDELLVANEVALAIVLVVRGKTDDARKHYEDALALAEKNNLSSYVELATESLGTLCYVGNQLDEADRWYKKALALAVKNRSVVTQIALLVCQARLELKRGNEEQALVLVANADLLTSKTNPRDASALVHLRRLQKELGQVPRSSDMTRAMETVRVGKRSGLW